MKRGVIILEWCFMCKTECESPISTLCHGQGIVVYDLSLVWCFLGHASLYAVDVFWRGRFGGRSDVGGGCCGMGGTWKGVPFYLMWCLWRERNAICFDMQELRVAKLKYYLLYNLYKWTSMSPMSSITRLLEFLDSLLFLFFNISEYLDSLESSLILCCGFYFLFIFTLFAALPYVHFPCTWGQFHVHTFLMNYLLPKRKEKKSVKALCPLILEFPSNLMENSNFCQT